MIAHPNKREQKGADLARAIDDKAKEPRPLERLAMAYGFNTFVFADDHTRTAWLGGNRVDGVVWLGVPFASPEKAAAFKVPKGWQVVEEYVYRAACSGKSKAAAS